tara:strand:- start:412 stop:1128 length:717 start_codon:yes stop_codon:yes gene_type:complete
MIIDVNFFVQTHSFFKDVSKEYLLPNLGNLQKDQISEKIDNSLVTEYDLVIENELIKYFNEKNFLNIISEENNSDLLKYDHYLTIDPIDGTRNFINGINKVVMMVSFIKFNKSIFSIIYDPIKNNFYHSFNNKNFKNHKIISSKKYYHHVGFLGSHAKDFFKNEISNYTEKKRSRSIGYDVIEILEGDRTFMTIYGSKIWDLFPAMSFLENLNFNSNLKAFDFDFNILNKKIIFYAKI